MNEEYTFSGQKEGEKVLEVLPSHPYTLYSPGFRVILVLSVATAIFLFFPKFWLIAVVLTLMILLYFFNAFYSYKETLLILTNMRVFSINQSGFFKRRITEAELGNIIDMSSNMQGMTKTMLKYGDLIIRTAGAREGGDIVVENISNPYLVQQKIAAVIGDSKKSRDYLSRRNS
jgi:hypothetical protein